MIDRNGSYSPSLDATGGMNVSHNLMFNNLTNLYGQINVQGDVTTNDGSIGGDGVVNFNNGSVTQNLSGPGQLPNVEINSSGTVNLGATSLSISGNWVNNGTFDAGTSTVTFVGSHTATVETGSSSFNNVVIDRNGSYSPSLDATGGMNVSGLLTFKHLTNLTGVIKAAGDVTTTDGSIGGDGIVEFTGTEPQNLSGPGQLPNVEINSSNTVTITSNTLSISGNWDFDGGTFDAGTSTVTFVGSHTAYVDTGSSSFYNVDINRSGYLSVVSPNGKLKVNNDLTITGVGNMYAPAGAITVGGDLSSSDPAVGGNADITMIGGGTAKIYTGTDFASGGAGAFPGGGIIINRAGYLDANVTQPLAGPLVINQLGNLSGVFQVGGDVTTNDSSIPGTGVVDFSRTTAGTQNIYVGHDYDQLPNVKIDSAGTVMLGAAKLSISGNWDYDQGTFDAGTSTVQFTGGGTAKIDTGSSSFDNVIIDRSGYISTIDADTSAAGVMNVAGSLTINKLGNLTGLIHASGDVTTSGSRSQC